MMQIARRLSSSTLFKRVFDAPKRSYAATTTTGGVAASDDAPTTKKKRKEKVSLVKRKAMVESYVNKYRAMNSGKFPTFSCVQKELGGCYYVIKRFVQEIEYNSRKSPPCRRDENIQQKDIIRGSKSSDGFEISSAKMTVLENIHQSAQDESLLVKEAANGRKSLPDLERVYMDVGTHEDTQKRKETLLSHEEDKSTEVEKVSRVQMTMDADLTRDAQTSLKTKSANKKKPANKNKPFAESEEVLFSQTEIDLGLKDAQTLAVNYEDSDFSKANDQLTTNLGKKASLDEIARPSATQGDTAEEIKVKSQQLKEEAFGFHSFSDKPQNTSEQESVSKGLLEVDGLKPEEEQLQRAEQPETFTRDLYKEHGDDKQPQRKSFTWDNLKSFANGIVNYWKKL